MRGDRVERIVKWQWGGGGCPRAIALLNKERMEEGCKKKTANGKAPGSGLL